MHFRRQLTVGFVMSLCRISFCVETNNCPAPCIGFSLPPMHLRAESSPETVPLDTRAAAAALSSVSPDSIKSENTQNDWDFHSRVFRSDRFYLTQAKAPPDNGFARFVDTIFTPEVVHVGKASVASPILTIAKRKNPLCLLSAFGTDKGLLTFNLLELSW
jgi:hypothetical protein